MSHRKILGRPAPVWHYGPKKTRHRMSELQPLYWPQLWPQLQTRLSKVLQCAARAASAGTGTSDGGGTSPMGVRHASAWCGTPAHAQQTRLHIGLLPAPLALASLHSKYAFGSGRQVQAHPDRPESVLGRLQLLENIKIHQMTDLFKNSTCIASSRSRSCMTQFCAKVHQLPGSCAAASRCSIVSTCSTTVPFARSIHSANLLPCSSPAATKHP
jgi:hypothetical protein